MLWTRITPNEKLRRFILIPDGQHYEAPPQGTGDLYSPRPFQRCPVCSYTEQAARRIIVGRTSKWGAKTQVDAGVEWKGKNCPECGEDLVANCDSCKAPLVKPDDVCCRNCGHRYWWHVAGEAIEPINSWAIPGNLVHAIGRISVFVVRHSLAKMEADALIASDNLVGAMVGHSATHLRQEGGREIEKQSMAMGSHQEGDAWETEAGGRLSAKYVIHVAVNGPDDSTSERTLERALTESLRLADNLGIECIAYPALGTGRSRFLLDESARLSYKCIAAYVKLVPEGTIKRIAFVLYSPRQGAEFRRHFASAAAPATNETPPAKPSGDTKMGNRP